MRRTIEIRKHLVVSLIVITVLSLMPVVILSEVRSPLDSIKPGEWYEVPDSMLFKVVPPRNPHVCLRSVGAVMYAWSGGTYDSKRERLIIWGGGHANYGGNEVYAFDVNKLKWERLTDPSPTTLCGGKLNTKAGQTDVRWNGDGTPVSRHTYDGLEYIPEPIDRLISHGGSRWFKGGNDRLTWMFDFERLKWERKADTHLNSVSPMSSYNPVNGHIFFHNETALFEYNPVNDTWRLKGKAGEYIGDGHTAEIDPVRQRFIIIGRGQAWYYDLKNSGMLKRRKLITTGANEIIKSFAPGLAYDSTTDKLVAWSGATTRDELNGLGDKVYVLDLNTLVWKRYTPVSKVAPPKGNSAKYSRQRSHGTFGRWRYIPSKDLFIGVNSIHSNVFFYRLPEDVKKIP